MLWKIFGPKKDEVTGEWRRLHNEKLHDVYSSPNDSVVEIKRSKMGEESSTYGGEKCLRDWGGVA